MDSTSSMAASFPSGTESKQSWAMDAATVGVAEGDARIWLAYAALTMAHGSVWLAVADVTVVFKATACAVPWSIVATDNRVHFILRNAGAVSAHVVQHRGDHFFRRLGRPLLLCRYVWPPIPTAYRALQETMYCTSYLWVAYRVLYVALKMATRDTGLSSLYRYPRPHRCGCSHQTYAPGAGILRNDTPIRKLVADL